MTLISNDPDEVRGSGRAPREILPPDGHSFTQSVCESFFLKDFITELFTYFLNALPRTL